jgi:hypothetical protein
VINIDEEEKVALEEGMDIERRKLTTYDTDERGLRTQNTVIGVMRDDAKDRA